ncbi:MAG: hypothetical protein J0H74_04720 [Chitinophagaceae bacterium]|nr:hypothetical protein [Chitinophagaceae bacterium]
MTVSMNKFLLLFVLAGLVFSCKSKPTSLSGDDEKVDGHDFVEFFQPMKLPWQATDTILRRKEAEGSIISYKVFTQLVPDSTLTKLFGRELKPKLYAIGKVSVPKGESYLFIKAATASRKALYIVCFTRQHVFAAARPVLYSDNESGVSGIAAMDAKYTLTLTHQRKASGGQAYFKRDAYIFNEDGGFRLILTESNEAKTKVPPIYNPIDTFPRKHKFTGDYVQDKRNIVSVRDGKDVSHILFFVHFEKAEGTCNGELKGEARFISANTARFRSGGDPCTVDFTFNPSGVSMKEVEGCGNHRDIKCFFEGYFERRKEPKPKPAKKKS